jgi:hypothetical protein
METSLIPPAQLWNYGITVDVVPKQYSDGKSLHGIHHPDEDIFIPFHMHGCISYFSTRLQKKNYFIVVGSLLLQMLSDIHIVTPLKTLKMQWSTTTYIRILVTPVLIKKEIG